MALHCFISISFDSIILSLNIALQLLRFDSCLASAPEKNSLYTKTSHWKSHSYVSIERKREMEKNTSIVRRNEQHAVMVPERMKYNEKKALKCWNMPTWRKKESDWITNVLVISIQIQIQAHQQCHNINEIRTSPKHSDTLCDDEKKWKNKPIDISRR